MQRRSEVAMEIRKRREDLKRISELSRELKKQQKSASGRVYSHISGLEELTVSRPDLPQQQKLLSLEVIASNNLEPLLVFPLRIPSSLLPNVHNLILPYHPLRLLILKHIDCFLQGLGQHTASLSRRTHSIIRVEDACVTDRSGSRSVNVELGFLVGGRVARMEEFVAEIGLEVDFGSTGEGLEGRLVFTAEVRAGSSFALSVFLLLICCTETPCLDLGNSRLGPHCLRCRTDALDLFGSGGTRA